MRWVLCFTASRYAGAHLALRKPSEGTDCNGLRDADCAEADGQMSHLNQPVQVAWQQAGLRHTERDDNEAVAECQSKDVPVQAGTYAEAGLCPQHQHGCRRNVA